MKKAAIRLLCAYLSCALILMGCSPGFMVKKDKNPVITKSEPVVTEDEPVVTQTKTQEAKVIFLTRPKPQAEPYKRLGLSKQYTVYSAQERIKKEGGEWKAFVNTERVILRNYGVKKGKRKLYGPGYLEPGHIFFAKFVNEDTDGNRIYRARFIGQCGNEIPDDDLMILETPIVFTKQIVITKRIATSEKIVFTDVDYGPALWAGLGGLLLGLGLGYLFWFGATETVVASGGIPCPPGTPGPVPLVP